MKNDDRIWLRVALTLIGAGIANAASLTTENFTGGLSGWTNNIDATKWVASTQAIRVSFSGSLQPQNAAIEGGTAASGGTFSGDYAAAGIEAIGFSFLAENVQPSVLKLEITGGTNIFFQDVRPRLAAVGNWNNVLVSLADRDSASWNGSPNSEFHNALTNIIRVAIRVTTSGINDQAYRLDDLFLDRLPEATVITHPTTNTVQITYAHLRPNFTYRQRVTDSIVRTWTNNLILTATNVTGTVTVTNAIPAYFYRLEN